MHIDTIGGGITLNLHRTPGDPANTHTDIIERERTIVMIKAGYLANLKVFPAAPSELAADDRDAEIKLLNEMYSPDSKEWTEADKRLRAESQTIVDRHWEAIQALAQALMARPVAPRPPHSFKKWSSPDTHERWLDGQAVAAILQEFQLTAIVRKESEGMYNAPDLKP